jgi:Glycosyl hydrolases family 39
MKGGFRDELRERHSSRHHYKPAFWEVFNEPEYEHSFSPAQYTNIYDAITSRLHRVDRRLKFTGASLAIPDRSEEFFDYFLDHSHHAPHARLDAISYHFYALEKKDETLEEETTSFFAQADHFLETVKKIEGIRKRLSPDTETQINETGCIAMTDQGDGPEKMSGSGIDPPYWDLCGAMFSYLAGRLAETGIEVVGASQLVGHPSQFPSVSLLDWITGLPNARYDSLNLLIDNLSPGDRFANSHNDAPELYVLPIIARNGQRKVLMVNKTSHDLEVDLAGDVVLQEVCVDVTSAGVQTKRNVTSNSIALRGFAVMIVSLAPQPR